MSEIRSNDVSLYYEEHGDGDPILCMHGTGSSSVLWRDAAAERGKRGRAIVYDRRGFSRSERRSRSSRTWTCKGTTPRR